MKRLLVLLPFLFFAGCDTAHDYTIKITNKSSASEVAYTYNGVQHTLNATNSEETYSVKAYTPPPSNISCGTDKPLSVKVVSQSDGYTFENATPLNLHVTSSLTDEVDLTAGNYIDNNGSIKITIKRDNSPVDAKIYTSSPQFTVSPDFYSVGGMQARVIVDYRIDGDTIYVELR
jgi:uncharacterized lipoprotein YajG